jgi:hypothetical protein
LAKEQPGHSGGDKRERVERWWQNSCEHRLGFFLFSLSFLFLFLIFFYLFSVFFLSFRDLSCQGGHSFLSLLPPRDAQQHPWEGGDGGKKD